MKARTVLALLPQFNLAEEEGDLDLLLAYNDLCATFADTVAEFVPKSRHAAWKERFFPEADS